jgi:SAM-dependent methyltransferase
MAISSNVAVVMGNKSDVKIMKKEKKTVSREIGLEIAAICGKQFLKLEHLHYGYWTGDLEVDLGNLCKAQENYVDFLISHIPEDVETILDVGCGMGQIAKKLLDMGYHVDCVSPSPFLTKHARDLLGNGSKVFECYYEQLQTKNQYDLILFSESFQYINPEEAIEKTLSFLNYDGRLLICDVFRTTIKDKCPISGGHSLASFYSIVSEYPFELIKDLDITEETAPNIDIENHIFKEVVHPVMNLLEQLMDNRYPFISKFLKWKYKKKIGKHYTKYLSGQRTGENFKKFKTYRLLLFKRNTLDSRTSERLHSIANC